MCPGAGHEPCRTHIYFDLDGTLTDPFEGITKSILYALDRLADPRARPRCAAPVYRSAIARDVSRDWSAPSERVVRSSSIANVLPISAGRRTSHTMAFTPHSSTLASAGHTLFVATTKPHVYAEKIVEHFAHGRLLQRRIRLRARRHSRRQDRFAALGAAAKPGDASATMVGDRKHDIVGALNNGMDAVGVSYGYGSIAELTASRCRKNRRYASWTYPDF